VAEERTYVVYILTSGHYGTLYIGVTNNIFRRMHEHRLNFWRSAWLADGLFRIKTPRQQSPLLASALLDCGHALPAARFGQLAKLDRRHTDHVA
jgi:GIY-YIG catalytic domain